MGQKIAYNIQYLQTWISNISSFLIWSYLCPVMLNGWILNQGPYLERLLLFILTPDIYLVFYIRTIIKDKWKTVGFLYWA